MQSVIGNWGAIMAVLMTAAILAPLTVLYLQYRRRSKVEPNSRYKIKDGRIMWQK